MKNMQQFMQQAQKMQQQIEAAQTKLGDHLVTGQSGGGLVKITMNGKAELKKIVIDPSLLVPEDKEVLEDLIIAAFNDGKNQAEKYFASEMASVTGGMLPPGFKLPI